ncbi:MAG TPA: DUF2007 domain-containing protein [Candidatus Limnocylindria bacterium]|jgi:hypothetical protein
MTAEQVIATTDSELDAEIIASRLRAEGIPARVRYESQSGVPRQIAPSGLGFGPGGFRISVPAEQAVAARDVLADVGPPSRSRSPLFRAIAIAVLISFVLVWVPGVVGALQAVFGPR